MKIKKKILAIIYKKEKKENLFLALRNNPKDKIHGGDYYYVITGGLNSNETNEQAIKREIEEETGIKEIKEIKDLDKVYIYTCSGEKGYLCKEYAYIIKVEDDVKFLNEEHIDYKWLNKKEFISLIKWENKNELNKLLDNY